MNGSTITCASPATVAWDTDSGLDTPVPAPTATARGPGTRRGEAVSVWVRRPAIGRSAELWHLIETRAPPRADRWAAPCGTSFPADAAFEELVDANPRDEERCPVCDRAYGEELRRL